jgi:hypothetical protein
MSSKYINPSSLSLISKMIKIQNTELIENYGVKHNLNDIEITNLKNKLIKLNHIYPNVIQKKNREYLQTLLIK